MECPTGRQKPPRKKNCHISRVEAAVGHVCYSTQLRSCRTCPTAAPTLLMWSFAHTLLVWQFFLCGGFSLPVGHSKGF